MLYPPFRFPAKAKPQADPDRKTRTLTIHTPATPPGGRSLHTSLGVAPPPVPPAPSSAVGSGVGSAQDEPADDDYHRYWRERDRARDPDAKRHARDWRWAHEWQTDHPGVFTPYFRSIASNKTGLQQGPRSPCFQQDGPHCVSYTALFICLRLGGYSPEEALDALRNNPALIGLRDRLHTQYTTGQTNGAFGSEISAILTLALHKLATCPLKHPLSTAIAPLVRQGAVLFVKRLGCHSHAKFIGETGYRWDVNLTLQDLHIQHVPSEPLRAPQATLQATLMRGYRHGGSVAPSSATQAQGGAPASPLPFIVITTDYIRDGKEHGHLTLVDLGDPRRPGIFDANGGWLEAPGGCSYLSMEQALVGMVAQYIQYGGKRNGMAWLAQNESLRHISAAQLYLARPAGPSAGGVD